MSRFLTEPPDSNCQAYAIAWRDRPGLAQNLPIDGGQMAGKWRANGGQYDSGGGQ